MKEQEIVNELGKIRINLHQKNYALHYALVGLTLNSFVWHKKKDGVHLTNMRIPGKLSNVLIDRAFYKKSFRNNAYLFFTLTNEYAKCQWRMMLHLSQLCHLPINSMVPVSLK